MKINRLEINKAGQPLYDLTFKADLEEIVEARWCENNPDPPIKKLKNIKNLLTFSLGLFSLE